MSHSHLSEDEQQLLAYLSMFIDSVSEDGLRALYENAGLRYPTESLEALTNNKLVHRSAEDEPQLSIPQPIREFASQRLVKDDESNSDLASTESTEQVQNSRPSLPSAFESVVGFKAARAVMAASSLGIFQSLGRQPENTKDLADRLELFPPAVESLVQVLDSMDYIYRDQTGRFTLSPPRRRWLLPLNRYSVESFSGGFAYHIWDAWSSLEQAIRSGKTVDRHSYPSGSLFWDQYIRGLFNFSKEYGPELAQEISVDSPTTLLDVAGGHAGFAIAFCDRYPNVRATVIDLEASAKVGQQIVKEEGYADRIDWIIGDIFEVVYGHDYDLALAGSILNYFTPQQCKDLLTRIRHALRPGATLVSFEIEYHSEPQRIGTSTALHTLDFLLSTGKLPYTHNQIADLLKAAGFEEVKYHAPFAGRMLLTCQAPTH